MPETKQVKKHNSKNEDPPGILEWLVDFFVSPIANAVKNLLQPIIGHPTDAEKSSLQGSVDAATGHFTGKSSPITVDTAEKELVPWSLEGSKRCDDAWLASVVLEGATLGQVDATVLGFMNNPKFRAASGIWADVIAANVRIGQMPFLNRSILKNYMPLIPEAYRLALAAAKGLVDWKTYTNAMRENGFNDDWSVIYMQQNQEYPTWQVLAELYWRGVIDDKVFTEWATRLGHPSNVIEALKSLRELIPPSQDLVTMVVREAFDPDWITPAPEVFAKYMAMKGFSKEWSDRYWTMHWMRMPLAQAYDNYYRGYWDEERLKAELRWADFHPGLHNDIVKVAYQPPSIREMGYGYDVGVYTEEDIITYRKWGGLSPEDADKAGKAMVAYRTEAERNAIRTELMYLYGRGKLSIEEFGKQITELGTAPAAIPLWVTRAKYYKERITKEVTPEEPTSITRSTAQWLFEQGLRYEDWFRKTLADLGFSKEAIDAYTDQSKKRIADAKVKAEAITPRLPSLTQIADLYKAGKVKSEDLYKFYMDLGYSKVNADALAEILVAETAILPKPRELTIANIVDMYDLDIITFNDNEVQAILNGIIKKEAIPSKTSALVDAFSKLGYTDVTSRRFALSIVIGLTVDMLRTNYKNGWITSQQMYDGILEVGVPKDKANEIMQSIIKAEQGARTATEKDLTKAEIIKGVKQGVLTTGQGVGLLQGIGYDESEAWYLLYINAVVSRGDPEGYWEMRKVVEQSKKARGQPSVNVPDELIVLELQLKETKGKLEKMKASGASEVELGQIAVDIANLESQMRTIISKLKLQ